MRGYGSEPLRTLNLAPEELAEGSAVVVLGGREQSHTLKRSAAAFAARSLDVVRGDADPSNGFPSKVTAYTGAVYEEVAGKHGLLGVSLCSQLQETHPQFVEEYFSRLTEETYDWESLLGALAESSGLGGFPTGEDADGGELGGGGVSEGVSTG